MAACALILLCLGLLGQDPPRVGEKDDAESRWRREYPRAAAELERIAQNVLAKGRFFSRPMGGPSVATEDLTVASSGDKKLFILDGRTIVDPLPKKPYQTEVFCQTPDYAFRLAKQSPADPYIITSYSIRFKDAAIFEADFGMFARCATVYMERSLSERMQGPSFFVKAAQFVRQGGNDLVQIDYTEDQKGFSESGAVYLDPSLNWAIRKVDVTTQIKGLTPKTKQPHLPSPFTSHVDYQMVAENVYYPKRMECTLQSGRPGVFQNDRLELSQVTVGNVPDSIFKLTGYGLPELPLKPVRESSVFSLSNPLLWGSVIATVVSFALLLYTRSRANSSPS